MRKTIYLGFSLLVLFFGSSAQAIEMSRVAPEFTLKDSLGEEHTLSSYQGKYVVLEWVNHDCPFVRKHYGSGNMQNLQKEMANKGVVWLSINSSAPGKQGYCSGEKAQELTEEKQAYPRAVLLDSDGRVGKMYEAKTTPHMYVINPDGELIYQGAIDDKPSADPSDITGAKNYVRSALDEALAGKEVSVSSTKSYGCSVKY